MDRRHVATLSTSAQPIRSVHVAGLVTQLVLDRVVAV